jgi:hypothetical protein
MSKNFTPAESACRCKLAECEKAGWLPWFEENVQDLRDAVGVPLRVNSGYRCKYHPDEIKKKIGTIGRHRQGIAADLSSKLPLEDLYNAARKLGVFHGIGINRFQNFIHLDCRPKEQAAMWAYTKTGDMPKWDGVWANLPKE